MIYRTTWMNLRTIMLKQKKADTKKYISNSTYEVLEPAKLGYEIKS